MKKITASDRVLITGASAGIGEEVAREFARQGHDVVLVARRAKELERLARRLRKSDDVDAVALACDLAAPDAIEQLVDELGERELDIDILINNAGVLTGGSFRNMEQDRIDAMLRLNVMALTALSRALVGDMVERGHGRIVNVASLAAFQPVPSLAVYAATKAYVLSLSEAMAEELRGKGVGVGAVCPGFTDTNMLTGASGGTELPAAIIMTPERVAEETYRACRRGEVIRVPGVGNALASASVRLMPRWLVRSISGVMARGGL